MVAPPLQQQLHTEGVRPGQAGPEPGDFFHDRGGPVVTNVHVVPMFWGSRWNDDRNPSPTLLQV